MCISWSGNNVSLVQIEALQDIRNVTGLMDMDNVSKGVVMNLEAHVVIHWPVCNLEHALKMCDDGV